MDRTADTVRGRHWEARVWVASGVLFGAAIGGLFLPWERRSAPRTGFDLYVGNFLDKSWSDALLVSMSVLVVATPVVGLTLSFLRTRRVAVVRAILAFVSVAPLAFLLVIHFGLTGRPPDMVGGWVTFWALVGAFVVNVIAAPAGRRHTRRRHRPDRGNVGPGARTNIGVGGS